MICFCHLLQEVTSCTSPKQIKAKLETILYGEGFQLGFYLLWFHCALVTGLNALMLLFISLALVLLFFTFTCGPHFFVMQMNKLIG